VQARELFKKKPVMGLFVLGFIALVGATLFWGFGANADKKGEPKPSIRPVKTMVLSEKAVTEIRSFPGLVKAAAETTLAFRVAGPLIDFDVRIGQRMEKGDVVARIDPRDFQIRVMRLSAALAEAHANLKAMRAGARAEDIAVLEDRLFAARSQMTESRKNFQRQKSLLADHAVSQAQYDSAKAAFDTAAANVDSLVQELKKARIGARIEDIEAAEARIRSLSADLKTTENQLDDTRLTAPFKGYINRKHVENHEYVKEGDPIVSLLDFSSVEVRTAIPEDLVIRRSEFAGIFCTLDAYSGRRFEAEIREVGRKTDSANQSYPLTVILHVPEDIVVEPGMAATLSLSLKKPGDRATGFVLPTVSVFADAEGNSCVWRIDPKTMRVIRTRVATGDLSGKSINILSGLKSGDRVVTAGARFLRDGQEVRILNKNREGRS
jgi:membrane fusion protein, multidrug efflux system